MDAWIVPRRQIEQTVDYRTCKVLHHNCIAVIVQAEINAVGNQEKPQISIVQSWKKVE